MGEIETMIRNKRSSSPVERFIASRERLNEEYPPPRDAGGQEEEGGCGVTGFACSIPVGGKHIFEPSKQMHNRGNGKGGGIAAVGFVPEALGVTQEILETHYMLQIALIDPEDETVAKAVEDQFILPYLDVVKSEMVPTIRDWRDIPSLEVRPPDIMRYFVRVKKDVLKDFVEKNQFHTLKPGRAEDEFMCQNAIKLNSTFYSTLGDKKAFVMSHGRNMMILKIVGYAEDVARYYKLEEFKAHIWIAHQRYPTKGRVWHPGGAHPFSGMDEALVHNGDFANYISVSEYLKARRIYPIFHTDTEVSVLLLDFWNRVYGYPIEYIIEAMAPTTEADFDQLPPEKQKLYRAIQASHIHGSPDGPWFFIIARNEPYEHYLQLIGITDTAMLRPQVFALQDNGEVQIGLVCSEKQAIDATLDSLSREDSRFCPVADRYWNARGGSHTDGGSFMFTIREENGRMQLSCQDKFGNEVSVANGQKACDASAAVTKPSEAGKIQDNLITLIQEGAAWDIYSYMKALIIEDNYNAFRWACDELVKASAQGSTPKALIIEALTLLNDRRFDTGEKKRASILWIVRGALRRIFDATPRFGEINSGRYRYIDWNSRDRIDAPKAWEDTLIVYTREFPPEGDDCDARLLCDAYFKGWKKFIVYGYRGQRFTGNGFGPETWDVKIDVYGSSGDYLASGIDGMTIHVHGNAQDQLGQIMKQGKLAIFGDVGQTFMYGAKGGEVYVMGNAAGRPFINAVGRPRVVINGTALDYLAESFMAGDPHNGGGFVILNGMEFNTAGQLVELATPYPGSNLFSLASGGAIFARDPHQKLSEGQLNGGEFAEFTDADWQLILPYLEENERLFGISIENDLLTVKGVRKRPNEIYRKIKAVQLAVLTGKGGHGASVDKADCKSTMAVDV
jgi:glutamate synthase domain-containing protein 1/glutamate synthase domain-containing protein 3